MKIIKNFKLTLDFPVAFFATSCTLLPLLLGFLRYLSQDSQVQSQGGKKQNQGHRAFPSQSVHPPHIPRVSEQIQDLHV